MKDLLSLQSFLLFLSMLAVTYSTRLIGFFALRNRTLSRRAQVVMEAAPGCVLISVIAPDCHCFDGISGQPVFDVGDGINRRWHFGHTRLFDEIKNFQTALLVIMAV